MAKPTGPDWKRIPPERRGRWGRFLVEQRWKHGDLTQVAVRDMLAKMGEELSGPYYSDFETGKAVPSAHWQGVFRRLWDAEPDPDPEPARPAQPSPDLSALIGALTAQTQAITALLERTVRAEERAAAAEEAVAGLSERLELVVSMLRERGGGGAPSGEPTPRPRGGQRAPGDPTTLAMSR